MYMYIYIYMYVCMYACMYVCMYEGLAPRRDIETYVMRAFKECFCGTCCAGLWTMYGPSRRVSTMYPHMLCLV